MSKCEPPFEFDTKDKEFVAKSRLVGSQAEQAIDLYLLLAEGTITTFTINGHTYEKKATT